MVRAQAHACTHMHARVHACAQGLVREWLAKHRLQETLAALSTERVRPCVCMRASCACGLTAQPYMRELPAHMPCAQPKHEGSISQRSVLWDALHLNKLVHRYRQEHPGATSTPATLDLWVGHQMQRRTNNFLAPQADEAPKVTRQGHGSTLALHGLEPRTSPWTSRCPRSRTRTGCARPPAHTWMKTQRRPPCPSLSLQLPAAGACLPGPAACRQGGAGAAAAARRGRALHRRSPGRGLGLRRAPVAGLAPALLSGLRR